MKNHVQRLKSLLLVLLFVLAVTGCSFSHGRDLPSVHPVISVAGTETEHVTVLEKPEPSPVHTDEFSVVEDSMVSEDSAPDIPASSSGTESLPYNGPAHEDSYFRIHFLDVAQADAALIECDGSYAMFDTGNAEDADFLIRYLNEHKIDRLDTLLITHGHEDHVGGAAEILEAAAVDTIYCSTTDFDTWSFSNFKTRVKEQGNEIRIPKARDSFSIGSATVDILSCDIGADENNNSIVTKITYGDTSFLLCGDAERDAEAYMLEAGYDLSCTVLKVGHHGSRNGTTYPFLREAMPEYAVISVGSGNEYGHPTEETLSRLRDCGSRVYRTDMQGTIIFGSNGTHVTVLPEREPDADTTGLSNNQSAEPGFILNIWSMKYHRESCEYAAEISDHNRKLFSGSTAELWNLGYEPCGACSP